MNYKREPPAFKKRPSFGVRRIERECRFSMHEKEGTCSVPKISFAGATNEEKTHRLDSEPCSPVRMRAFERFGP